MASPAQILRLCVRSTGTGSSRLAAAVANHRVAAVVALSKRPQLQHQISPAAVTMIARRPISTTPSRRSDDEADEDEEDDDAPGAWGLPEVTFMSPDEILSHIANSESSSEAERQAARELLERWQKVPARDREELERLELEMMQTVRRGAVPKPRKDTFWNEEESDRDLITDEVGEDDFDEDDMTAMAHAKLEEHREYRHYARVAIWEMPLLAKLAKKFEPPTQEQVLRFRYTTYMGEWHPGDRKVVVEFCPSDIPGLTEEQQLKLKKLAGARYNPEKDIVRMSCERFEHQAQNKRYLGDLVNKLIAAAKDPTDTFADIPLDTRHHEFKKPIKFPREWYLTPERKQQLLEERKRALLLDEQKREQGLLVDGRKVVEQALKQPVPVGVRMVRGGPQGQQQRVR